MKKLMMEFSSTSKLIRTLISLTLGIVLTTALPKPEVDKNSLESRICLTPGCIHAASNVLKNINSSVDPCDDFYKFACGGFIERTPIPADKSIVTSYTMIRDLVQERLKALIEEIPKANVSKPFLQLKRLYKTCLNRTAIEKKGLVTIQAILIEMGGWPILIGSNWKENGFDWKEIVYKLRKLGYGASYILGVSVGINAKNSSQRVITLDQPGLGLNQKYLLQGQEQDAVKAYYDYMVNVSVILGANREAALKELKESLEFEIKLAGISISQEQRRNVVDLYNPSTVGELQVKYPDIPWNQYISNVLGIEISDDETIIVKVPQYLDQLEELLRSTPVRVLANYLGWRTVKDSVPYLTQDLANQKLEFNRVRKGVTERKHRSKECVDMASNRMDLAMGALYARRYFNTNARKRVMEMMSDIRAEFVKILQQLDWMDEATKENALEKAAVMSSYIAYADEIYDDEKLEEYYSKLELDSDDYLLTVLKISLFNRMKTVGKLREGVNKTEWTTRASPAEVNAYYDALENSIQFPAAILQGAYFKDDRPNYMNYGAIGSVIGHEITHGFDDKGRQYDKEGNLIDWWAKQTRTTFTKGAQCIIDQYSSYSIPEINLNLNGVNTQGENIADNGGIKEAYLAYQEWVRRNGPELQLPGLDFTPEQLFWVSAATPYCSKSRQEFLKLTVLTDPHSPGEFRVNVPFSNTEHFANDFNCPLGSKMNPEHKCQVW